MQITRQPTFFRRLRRDGLYAGLVACIVPINGRLVDLVNPSRTFTRTGRAYIAGAQGHADDNSAGTGSSSVVLSPALPTGSNFTLHVMYWATRTSTANTMIANSQSPSYQSIGYISSGNLVIWDGAETAFSPSLAPFDSTTRYRVLSIWCSGGTASSAIIDNGPVSTCAHGATQDITQLFGDSVTGNRGWSAVPILLAFNRAQSEAEVREIQKNIWNVFGADEDDEEAVVASADITITQSAPEALVLAEQQGVVGVTIPVAQSASEALVITENAGTVAVTIPIVQGASEALVITENAGVVSVAIPITQGAAEALVLAEQTGIVSVTIPVAQPAPEALVLTENAGSVSLGSAVEITQGTPEALTITENTGVVTLTVDVVQGAPEALVLTENQGVVSAGEITESASTAQLFIDAKAEAALFFSMRTSRWRRRLRSSRKSLARAAS